MNGKRDGLYLVAHKVIETQINDDFSAENNPGPFFLSVSFRVVLVEFPCSTFLGSDTLFLLLCLFFFCTALELELCDSDSAGSPFLSRL
jgi:hypothetical protein